MRGGRVNTKALNHLAAVICRAQEQDRTPMGIAFAIDSAGMHMSPEFKAELERLAAEVVQWQGAAAEHQTDAARARRERDEMRERVSEPYGCQHCGIAKGSHGRRWMTGVGVHAWEAPTQGQIAERMRARRTVRVAADNERLRAQVAELEAQRDRRRSRLVALQNDALNMRGALSPNGEDRKVPFELGETLTPAVDWLIARVAELEAERHSTNEALSDVMVERSADKLTALFAPTQALRVSDACKTCGAPGEQRCPDCGVCPSGCSGGRVGISCTHPTASWGVR